MDVPPSGLVAAAQRGDPRARGEIYDRFAGDVQRFLVGLRLGLGADELEDAVQEAFLRLFRDFERFDPQRRLRPYVLSMARHVAIDLCRKKKPQHGDADQIARGPSAGSDVAKAEQRELVDQALGALEPEHKSVLALRHLQGLTMLELADSLGCSVPTARKRLRKAVRLLRRELRQLGVLPKEDAK